MTLPLYFQYLPSGFLFIMATLIEGGVLYKIGWNRLLISMRDSAIMNFFSTILGYVLFCNSSSSFLFPVGAYVLGFILSVLVEGLVLRILTQRSMSEIKPAVTKSNVVSYFVQLPLLITMIIQSA